MDIFYNTEFLEQARGPSQVELRRALERRAGDPFLIKQPPDRSFPATHQRHTRGIWTDATRRDLLSKIRQSSNLSRASRDEFVKKLWRENDMAWLKTSLVELKRAVVRAQDLRMPVTREVNERVNKKYPGLSTALRLLDQDRIVNRGNAHMELRTLAPAGSFLVGWTLDTPGAMLQLLKSGKLEEIGRNKVTNFDVRARMSGRERAEADRIQTQKKSVQPVVWLRLVTKERPVFEARVGEVGATPATAGRFDFITGGGRPFRRRGAGRVGFSVVYGIRRSNFHEQFHFYEDPKLHRTIGGRWTFRILKLSRPRTPIAGREAVEGQDELEILLEQERIPEAVVWLARRANDPTPFIFKNDFEDEVTQARREKTDLFWNLDQVKALEKLQYFRDFDLLEELEKFKLSDRAKRPLRGGVVRFRPKGKLAKAPAIFSESTT